MNTILCHGVFDVLHLGHIRHLQEARSLGDRLVVSITADRHVAELKGHGRPQFSAEQRREALQALSSVDEVIVSDDGTAIEVIKSIRPAYYVKGPDYSGKNTPELAAEVAAIESVGGKFYTTTAEKWSSTALLRDVRLTDKALRYVDGARRRKFLDHIMPAFDNADKLRLLFVGETIIDEYRYVKALNRPSKEIVIAAELDGKEVFDGGVVAGSKHADWPDKAVITSKNAIIKTRFVDRDFSRKLFETYSHKAVKRLVDRDNLAAQVKDCDVCVVMDFGHGLIDDEAVDILSTAKFLGVTAQTNAGNFGFNLITKYRHCSFACIDEQEAKLAVRDLEIVAARAVRVIAHDTGASYAAITQGRRGSTSWSNGGDIIEVPAFVTSGYDTMGAGDAFLAVTAPLLAVGLQMEMAAFVGNVAGGLKTAVLGHQRHISREDIVRNLEWLLK